MRKTDCVTLIHIHDEPQQDMDSCNITGIEGQKQQTKQLQRGKEMENTLELLSDIPNSWIRMGHRWNSEFNSSINRDLRPEVSLQIT